MAEAKQDVDKECVKDKQNERNSQGKEPQITRPLGSRQSTKAPSSALGQGLLSVIACVDSDTLSFQRWSLR